MSQANDSKSDQKREDLRRQLAERLGRLVAREYRSRRSVRSTAGPMADSNPSHTKRETPYPYLAEESIIPPKPNDAEAT
jgi:hypothetical protein